MNQPPIAQSNKPPAHRRIVLVTGSLHGGGAERVLSGMANHWARAGREVTLATWADPQVQDFYPLDANVQRVWLADTPGSQGGTSGLRQTWRRIIRLRALLREWQPGTVLSFISTSNVMTLLATIGSKSRVVVSERIDPSADNTIGASWKVLRRLTYPFADGIVVQNADVARWVRRKCLRRATVIPNPLRTLPELALPREPLIVAVGRLAHQKGFDVLLRAFAQIADRFADWNLAIVGEGAERDALQALCDQLQLNRRVRFVGMVSDVESWMARAGLVVQPSRFEGFPNVLLEAMGMGAPVISSDCPSGPSEIIDDGRNGLLVPVADVPALAAAMAQLLGDPKQRARLGDTARAVRERFDNDRIMQQWEQCLFE